MISASEAPPLALDRYATLQAEIEAGSAQDDVLTKADVPTERWLAAHAYWLKRMAEEAERKRFETTIRYQTVYSVKRKLFENRAARERDKGERPPVAPPPVAVMSMMGQALAQPAAVQLPPAAFPAPPLIERTRAPEPSSGLPSFLRQGARPAAQPAPVQPAQAMPPAVIPAGTGTLPAPPPNVAPAPVKPNFIVMPAKQAEADADGLARRRRANMTMNIDRAELEAAAAVAVPARAMPRASVTKLRTSRRRMLSKLRPMKASRLLETFSKSSSIPSVSSGEQLSKLGLLARISEERRAARASDTDAAGACGRSSQPPEP